MCDSGLGCFLFPIGQVLAIRGAWSPGLGLILRDRGWEAGHSLLLAASSFLSGSSLSGQTEFFLLSFTCQVGWVAELGKPRG